MAVFEDLIIMKSVQDVVSKVRNKYTIPKDRKKA